MKKKLQFICGCLLIMFALCACMDSWVYQMKPCNQPNTKWVSDDSTIEFVVSDDLIATGTIRINGEAIDIYVTEGPARSAEMHVFPVGVLEHEVISEQDKYEYWLCAYKSESEFTATVQKTTFFDIGQKIHFTKQIDT